MKKFVVFILAMISIVFQSIAQEPTNNSSNVIIDIEIHEKRTENSSSRHRVSAHIDIEAFYDYETQTIEISYEGECEGEVTIYLDGNPVGYDSAINTSFHVTAPGVYKIEVTTESWIAEGYLQL